MQEIKNIDDKYYGKYLRVVPHKFLKQGRTFIAVQGHDKIIMINVGFSKVTDIVNEDGTNVVNPKDGSPMSRYTPKFEMKFITKDEYEKLSVELYR